MSKHNWLYDKPIAHRGLHNETIPENSLASFKAAKDKGYNIEIDIHLLEDGDFAVFHDANLRRMCGVKQRTDKLTSAELKDYKLNGTKEHIPTLKEVFDVIDGKVGILIEIKTLTNRIIAQKLNEYIENSGYTGDFAIQCFSPISLKWFRKNTTDIPVGILAFDYRRIGLIGLLGYHLSCGVSRKIIKPDFIAYKVEHLPFSGVTKQKEKGLKVLCWTVNTPEKLERARKYTDNIIFENEQILIDEANKK